MTPAVPQSDAGVHATRGAARDAIGAQHSRDGGMKRGAAFFGWLLAIVPAPRASSPRSQRSLATLVGAIDSADFAA